MGWDLSDCQIMNFRVQKRTRITLFMLVSLRFARKDEVSELEDVLTVGLGPLAC